MATQEELEAAFADLQLSVQRKMAEFDALRLRAEAAEQRRDSWALVVEACREAAGVVPGTDLVAHITWLHRVAMERNEHVVQLTSEWAERGRKLEAAERDAAWLRKRLADVHGFAAKEWPEEYRRDVLQNIARLAALSAGAGEDQSEAGGVEGHTQPKDATRSCGDRSAANAPTKHVGGKASPAGIKPGLASDSPTPTSDVVSVSHSHACSKGFTHDGPCATTPTGDLALPVNVSLVRDAATCLQEASALLPPTHSQWAAELANHLRFRLPNTPRPAEAAPHCDGCAQEGHPDAPPCVDNEPAEAGQQEGPIKLPVRAERASGATRGWYVIDAKGWLVIDSIAGAAAVQIAAALNRSANPQPGREGQYTVADLESVGGAITEAALAKISALRTELDEAKREWNETLRTCSMLRVDLRGEQAAHTEAKRERDAKDRQLADCYEKLNEKTDQLTAAREALREFYDAWLNSPSTGGAIPSAVLDRARALTASRVK